MTSEVRLIDAKSLWEKANELEMATAEECGWQEMCDGMNQVKELIEQAPTIDPETLRPKGRWVMKETMIRSPFAKNAYCSECLEETARNYNYCPNCGAKMEA